MHKKMITKYEIIKKKSEDITISLKLTAMTTTKKELIVAEISRKQVEIES